ncbi:hypothetical protein TNCV_2932451 [Trichonephila clavipes]|nr:hypothetical protein TNCV_2932451 [Trichonephila clavipes]
MPVDQDPYHDILTRPLRVKQVDSWLRKVFNKFNSFPQYKIRCSVIHLTTLPVSNPKISSVFFPNSTANEFSHLEKK